MDGNNATFTHLLPATQGLLAQQAFRLAQPSAETKINLSVSSFPYTAPCDGFVELRAERTAGTPAAISLTNLTTNIIYEIQPTTSGYGLTLLVPCIEGDRILYRISNSIAVRWIYFRSCRYVQTLTVENNQ